MGRFRTNTQFIEKELIVSRAQNQLIVLFNDLCSLFAQGYDSKFGQILTRQSCRSNNAFLHFGSEPNIHPPGTDLSGIFNSTHNNFP
ncbi:MAG: hypothetical protein R2682_00515 [Pyrinomonadaceae bacterium]